MTQAFPLFVLIAGLLGHLAHLLKIGNRFVIFREEHLHEISPFVHRQEVGRIRGGVSRSLTSTAWE
jgi:hypothetical protein